MMTIAFRTAVALSTTMALMGLRPARESSPLRAAPFLSNLTAPTTSVVGGGTLVVIVQLSEPAGPAGFSVSMRASNAVMTVQATATVPPGATTFPVPVNSSPVSSSTLTTITATAADGIRKSVDLRTIPPSVATVALAPSTVVGGQPTTATVTLNGAAPAGGLAVGLRSNSTALVVPSTVTVAASARTVQVNATTTAVPANVAATVTATTGTVTATGAVTLTPAPPRIVSITAAPNLVANSNASVTVTFSRALDTTTALRIVTSDTLATPRFILDAAVKGQTSKIVTFIPKGVTANRPVTLSAAMNGDSVRVATTVVPMTVAVRVSPDSVIGTGSATGTITLNAVPASPIALTLSSSQSAASVPSSFTMNSSTATFTISTFAVQNDVRASITARLASTLGGGFGTGTLNVIPATIARFVVTPDSVFLPSANALLSGDITYSIPAPAGGVVIALSSTSQMSNLPTTVLLPAGSNRVGFTATVSDLVAAGNYSLVATTQNGRSAQAPFRVVRAAASPEVASIVIPQAQALGGATVSGTVTLNAPAIANYSVQLGAPTLIGGVASMAFQPAVIPFAVGQTTATFTATPVSVATATPLQITAVKVLNGLAGGSMRSDTVTVLPGTVSSFTLPQSTLASGLSLTGTATLTTPRGSVPFGVTSSDTSAATVFVGAGSINSTSVPIVITARSVAAPKTATITVTYAGSSQSATLTIQPAARLVSFTVPSGPILPLSFPATITLSAPAPPGGATALLVSSAVQGFTSGLASTQSTVTVPAGQTSATFQLTPLSPRDLSIIEAVSVTYTPTGQQQSDFRSDSIEVRNLVLDGGAAPGDAVAFTLKGGDSVTVTVRTNVPAPTNGLTLNGTSPQPTAATITPSVTIPAGQTSATFKIVAQRVSTSTQLQAQIAAVGLSAFLPIVLTVNP